MTVFSKSTKKNVWFLMSRPTHRKTVLIAHVIGFLARY